MSADDERSAAMRARERAREVAACLREWRRLQRMSGVGPGLPWEPGAWQPDPDTVAAIEAGKARGSG